MRLGHALSLADRGAIDGVGQPFPLPDDPPTLRVVPDERLDELHGVFPDDLADRGPVRRALFEQVDEVLVNRTPAAPRPEVPQVPLQRIDRPARPLAASGSASDKTDITTERGARPSNEVGAAFSGRRWWVGVAAGCRVQ